MRGLITPHIASIFGLVLLGSGLVPPAAGQQHPVAVRPEEVRAEVTRLLRDLDCEQYAVRRKAARQLQQMAAKPELGRVLAEEFQRVLLSSETSFEVRTRLERLRAGLPRVVPEPLDHLSPEEVKRLVDRLENESYAVRLGAAKRLEWLLGNSKLVAPIVIELRGRLSRGDLSPDARQWLEPVWKRARGLWLTTDPSGWHLPPVPEEQFNRWIDDLARPAPEDATAETWTVHRDAERELRDLLARDEYVPQVRRAIETRLEAGGRDPRGAARLAALVELCRPAMVAEFWQRRRHGNIQHLLVGVPTQSPGAPRPSHFDRIDDEVAHCVSGSNLTEGDYPVGVAIPHPNQPGAIFHLVNLPTPRRRMAYEYLAKLDEGRRLAELSRRTFDRFLRLKRPLADAELMLLPQLDPKEMSRFVGKFLLAVEDDYLPPEGPEWLGGWPSRHGVLCAFLAEEGTRDAVPGLLEAIRQKRILPPSAAAPHEMGWIAALSIAARDPWPEVDDWLAGLVPRTEPLVIDAEGDVPDLGATAAGLLLTRHQQTPSQFGLEPARDEVTDEFGLPVHRVAASPWRQKVLDWWEEAKRLRKAAG